MYERLPSDVSGSGDALPEANPVRFAEAKLPWADAAATKNRQMTTGTERVSMDNVSASLSCLGGAEYLSLAHRVVIRPFGDGA